MFSHTQSDVLTSLTSVIGYIDPLTDSTIFDHVMTYASHYAYFYLRSVESSALRPRIFSVALSIVQNINQKDHANLVIQPDCMTSGDKTL